MKKKKLRIGLLTMDHMIPSWVFELLADIRKSKHTELTLVVYYDYGKRQKILKRTNRFCTHFVFFLHTLFEKLLFQPKPNALASKSLKELLDKPAQILHIQTAGSTALTAKEDIRKLRSYQIDVLIMPNAHPIPDYLLTVAKYGIWSVFPRHAAENTTDVAGIREVIGQQSTTWVTLHQYTCNHNSDQTLSKSSFCTNWNSASWNRHLYFWKTKSMILQKLEELHKLGESKAFLFHDKRCTDTISGVNTLDQLPGNMEMVTGIYRLLGSYLKRKIRNLFFLEQWVLMIGSNNFDRCKPIFKDFQRITPSPDRLWADPFIVQKNNKYFVFFEEMLYKDQKGRIAVFEMDKNGICGEAKTVLERNYHLSYPFIFQDNGGLFMLPESSKNRTIEIYECIQFPMKWVHRETLFHNIEAADTTLFNHDNKYWLFTSIRKNPHTSINDELYLFFSDRLLGGSWTPHPNNPVVSNVEASRPGGSIFTIGKRIFRPAQNASKYYGYGMQIMEITNLSEEAYEEKPVQTIKPHWERDIMGTHTYNFAGPMTVIDALIRRRRLGT